jgi:hypothetical protein
MLVAVILSALAACSAFRVNGPVTRAARRLAAVNDKLEVEEYFNNEGFNRWNKVIHSILCLYFPNNTL